MLEPLATDVHSDVRSAIAQNPNTPTATLKTLANDGNRVVRATAKESLQTR